MLSRAWQFWEAMWWIVQQVSYVLKFCTYDDLSRVVRWMNREEERAKANQWPDTWANKNTRAISWYLNPV